MGKQQTYIALIPTSPRIDCMSVLKTFGKYSDKTECVVHDLVPHFDIWIFESGFMTLHQTSPTPLPPHNVCVTFLLPLTQPQPPLICLPKMYLELNMALDGGFGCLYECHNMQQVILWKEKYNFDINVFNWTLSSWSKVFKRWVVVTLLTPGWQDHTGNACHWQKTSRPIQFSSRPQELATSSPKCPSGDVKAWYETVSSRTDIKTPVRMHSIKKGQKGKQIAKFTSLTLLWLSLSSLPSSQSPFSSTRPLTLIPFISDIGF